MLLELRFLEGNSHERDDCNAGMFGEGMDTHRMALFGEVNDSAQRSDI